MANPTFVGGVGPERCVVICLACGSILKVEPSRFTNIFLLIFLTNSERETKVVRQAGRDPHVNEILRYSLIEKMGLSTERSSSRKRV